MNNTAAATRFDYYADLAGLSLKPAEFKVVSTSTIGGPDYVIGWTDDVALAYFAAKMLDQTQAVPCEKIVAR